MAETMTVAGLGAVQVQEIEKFHPIAARWFARKFGEATDVQRKAWASIKEGKHTLVAAPTGSGKTLAALLPLLDAVLAEKRGAETGTGNGEGTSVELGAAHSYRPGVRVLYVTPLKALNNDIYQHLFEYMDELASTAEEIGCDWPGIRVGVRTGDTSQSTRASMIRRPPDVLVTTPESLFILLTAPKASAMLRSVRYVVVDEIHDLAGGERGMHLSVTLERLEELCGEAPQRIGVSATVKPAERIARFLGGYAGTEPRPVEIVESRMERTIGLSVVVPQFPAVRGRNEDVWSPLVREILRHSEGARSTIVFVNNRRLCERLTARLNEMAGEDYSRSHHGSVSKERRLETERMLREGRLRCLVATSSLELGIDIGYVDLVLQIDSPLSAASGIQRIGRAGHAVGGVSRGVIINRLRGGLPETAVLARRIAERDIEEIRVPKHGAGVLVQQIAAIVASKERVLPDDIYRIVQRSDAYHDYPRDRFDKLVDLAAGLYPFVRPLVDREAGSGALVRRPGTAMAAIAGAGTIPQSTGYPVYHAEQRIHLGELDEEYIFESRVGDVFQLGTSSWRIRSIREDRVEVIEADRSLGEIPFWRAEGPGRTYELGEEIGQLVDRLLAMLPEGEGMSESEETASQRLQTECRFSPEAADSLIALLKSQRAVSAWPTHRRIVVEWYTDESGLTHVVLHNWFGRKFNLTWMIALRRYIEPKVRVSFDTTVKDNGIEFIFREWDPAWLRYLQGVDSENVEQLLLEAIPVSPLFALNFRNMAETALLLARSFRRTPGWLKRLRGQELLRDALPYGAKFPLVQETLRQCLDESLDLPRLRQVLERIEQGEMELVAVQSPGPSPLAAQYFFDYLNRVIYESDSLTEELQERMAGVSRELAAELFGKDALSGPVERAVLAEEKTRLEEGSDILLRERRDIVRLLKERGDLTRDVWHKLTSRHEQADRWLAELQAEGVVTTAVIAGEERLICADERQMYENLPSDETARHFVLSRCAETVVSFTPEQLAERYGLPQTEVQQMIESWRQSGLIVPAPFAEADEYGTLWTGAKAASRMIRASLMRNRGRQADPDRYCLWLLEQHRLVDERRLQGPDGLREAIRRLQGIFLPLSWWESSILPARAAGYRREDLDALCAAGELLWLGWKEEGAKEGKIAFFLQEAADLYRPFLQRGVQPLHPELYELLKQRGASFLTRLSAETGEAPTELMPKLMDLVWQGLVANDQFAPVRMHGSGVVMKDRAKFRSGLGRWYAVDDLAAAADDERSVLAWARHLLQMNGVAARYIAAEYSPYSWDVLGAAYHRLEEWGIVTRGLLVSGIPALQFAERETARQLREPERIILPDQRSATLLSSVDPANPYGIAVDWPDRDGKASFARKPGNYLLFFRGRWQLWAENRGRRLFSIGTEPLDAEAMDACLRKLVSALLREYGMRKVVIEAWDGVPIADTPAGTALAALGAERDRGNCVIWPSTLSGIQ